MQQDGLIALLNAALERLSRLSAELAQTSLVPDLYRLAGLIPQTQRALSDANTAYLVLSTMFDPDDRAVLDAITTFEATYEAIRSTLARAQSALGRADLEADRRPTPPRRRELRG